MGIPFLRVPCSSVMEYIHASLELGKEARVDDTGHKQRIKDHIDIDPVVGVASRLIIAVEAPEAPGSISSSRNESSTDPVSFLGPSRLITTIRWRH